ncbi:sugar ABC transporter permease [soil metagenome]
MSAAPDLAGTPRSPLRLRLGTSERINGALFVAPAVIGILIFTLVPIAMAFGMSFRDWNGISPPFQAEYVGLGNYRDLLTEPGVPRSDFGISLRNNLYYVIGVVPVQTSIAFVLAVIVNQRFLRGKGFFRSAYYFPSITSSIAVALIFTFLFSNNGAINALLGTDITWLADASGLIHNLLAIVGVDTAPAFLAERELLGLSWWQWLSGPSVTMFAIMILATWTTIGTQMLIFLAGLQNIPVEVEEASMVDGATGIQRFFRITLPMMKPTLFFVLTVGIIGTWQVFDQIFAISAGGPQKTTFTPAYLVYREGFRNFAMGRATAVSFLLFIIIGVFTILQRRLVSDEI